MVHNQNYSVAHIVLSFALFFRSYMHLENFYLCIECLHHPFLLSTTEEMSHHAEWDHYSFLVFNTI